VLQNPKSRPSLPALATVRQGYKKINANFLLGALIFSLRVTFGVCHLFLGCKTSFVSGLCMTAVFIISEKQKHTNSCH
jgi:hypothetical protein